MAELQDVEGARVLIVWSGKRIDVRSNAPPDVVVLLCDAAHKLALEKWTTAGAPFPDFARKVGKG